MFGILILFLGVLSKEENDLHVLFDKNYKQFLDKNEISMLFFFTPQCGHCERFQPEVEKAAKQLKEEGYPFAKVDGHNYKDIAKQFEVNGFPSVVLSQDHGKKYKKFEGPRTSDSVIMWMYEQLNSGSVELTSIEQIREKIANSQLMFLFMAPNSEDRGFKRYKDYSHVYGNLQFYHTFLENAALQLGFGPTDSLVAYKKYDKSPVVYQPKQIKVSDLKAFIETNQFQRLQEYNEELAKKIFKQDRQALVLLVDETQVKDKNAQDALKSIALEHPHEDHLLFVQCSVNNPLFLELQKQLGDFSGLPSLIGLQKYGIFKFKFNSGFTKANLDQFIIDFKNGKAPKHFKSQKLDNPIHSLNVEHLTGNSYQKVIAGNDDWVILYYNSFDSEHLTVIQDFSEIAKHMGQISKVKFGLADVTANEFSDFSDPTDVIKIRIYKGNKNFTKFILKSNKIQRERLITFIKEHSNYEFHDEYKHHDDL